jgi:hypothetical protein
MFPQFECLDTRINDQRQCVREKPELESIEPRQQGERKQNARDRGARRDSAFDGGLKEGQLAESVA